MAPRASRLDALNIALIFAGCVAGHLFPFGLLTASYAILGPAHYLTQISWLHDKRYFSTGSWYCGAMCCFAILLTLAAMLPLRHVGFAAVVLILAVGMAGASLARTRGLAACAIVLGLVGCFAVGALHPAAAFVAVLLPTVLHVFVFTAAFMVLGAVRARSAAGLAAVGVLLVASLSFWLVPVPATSEPAGGATTFFWSVVDELVQLGVPHNSTASMFGFLGMVYAYHYANWFSKAEVIRWHKISGARMVAIAVAYVVLLGFYALSFTAGFVASLFLSILHVLLELPLNLRTLGDLARASSARRRDNSVRASGPA